MNALSWMMKKTLRNKTVTAFAVVAGLVGTAKAAPVTWGSVTTITAASDIDSADMTDIAGANFGVTTGTTTLVNNGTVDVEFKSMNSGQNVTLANGINVAAASAWENWGVNGGNSSMTGNFGTILDSNLGIEGATSADITLSGLTIGTQYRVQFFIDSTGSNTQTISGSGNMNSLNGQFVTGTFTADATSQVLTVTRATDFGVANALTVGVLPGGGGPDTTPPTVLSIVDSVSGGPIYQDGVVTYTVTFSEPIDGTTVTAADFDNAGTAGISVGTVTEISSTVFTVVVTPSSDGTLQLRIPTGSVINDISDNTLVVPVLDDTTITINAGTTPASGTLYWDGPTTTGITDGVSQGGTADWDTTTTSWDMGSGFTGPVAWNNAATPSAVFGGVAGTVTVTEPISISNLTFNISGSYIVNGGTLNFAPGAIIANSDNRYNQTITSAITGSPAVHTKDWGAGNTYLGLKFAPSSGTVTLGNVLNPNNSGNVDKAGITFAGSTTGNTIASIDYASADKYADSNFQGGEWTVNGIVRTGTLRISGGRAIINGNVTTEYSGLVMSGTGVLGGSTTVFKNDRRATFDFVSGTGIAPGNGVGTITFDWGTSGTPSTTQWTTAFRVGSSYEWELGASASDIVHIVDGRLIVEGFKLKIIDAGGKPKVGDPFPVFTYGTLASKTLSLGSVVLDTTGAPDWDADGVTLVDNGSGTIYLTGLKVKPKGTLIQIF